MAGNAIFDGGNSGVNIGRYPAYSRREGRYNRQSGCHVRHRRGFRSGRRARVFRLGQTVE